MTARDLVDRRGRWADEGQRGVRRPQPESWTRGDDRDPRSGLLVIVDDRGLIESASGCGGGPQGVLVDGDRTLVAEHDAISSWSTSTLDGRETFSSLACFNDLHSLRATDRGVLVASTGVDAIVEVDRADGSPTWTWFAIDHGFDVDALGVARLLDDVDHRDRMYDTWLHTVHVNSAVAVGRDLVLASLFHQGAVVAIDRASGSWGTAIDGLQRPHALRLVGDEVTLADTAAGRALRCRFDGARLHVASAVSVESTWLQDCTHIDGLWLLVDGERSRVVFHDDDGLVAVDQFDDQWWLYEAAVL